MISMVMATFHRQSNGLHSSALALATFLLFYTINTASGFDCPADPQLAQWVDPDNNCYNYAVNYRSDSFAQPGRISGRPPLTLPLSCDSVSTAAQFDGLWTANNPGNCNEAQGECLVYLVVNESPHVAAADYHWYRHNHNSNVCPWSHKMGSAPAGCHDASGNPVLNPVTANHLYRSNGRGDRDYPTQCGYMCAPCTIIVQLYSTTSPATKRTLQDDIYIRRGGVSLPLQSVPVDLDTHNLVCAELEESRRLPHDDSSKFPEAPIFWMGIGKQLGCKDSNLNNAEYLVSRTGDVWQFLNSGDRYRLKVSDSVYTALERSWSKEPTQLEAPDIVDREPVVHNPTARLTPNLYRHVAHVGVEKAIFQGRDPLTGESESDKRIWTMYYNAMSDALGGTSDNILVSLNPMLTPVDFTGDLDLRLWTIAATVPNWSVVMSDSGVTLPDAYESFMSYCEVPPADVPDKEKLDKISEELGEAIDLRRSHEQQMRDAWINEQAFQSLMGGHLTFEQWAQENGYAARLAGDSARIAEVQGRFQAELSKGSGDAITLARAVAQFAKSSGKEMYDGIALPAFLFTPSVSKIQTLAKNGELTTFEFMVNKETSHESKSEFKASGSVAFAGYFDANGVYQRVEINSDSSKFSITFQGFVGKVDVATKQWLYGPVLKAFFGKLKLGSPKFFGENGMMSAKVKSIYFVSKPTITFSFDADTFQSLEQQWEAKAILKIGPFSIQAGASQSEYSAYFDKNTGNVQITNVASDPSILAVGYSIFTNKDN